MELEIELEAGKVSNLFTKVKHEIPLKSLQDVFSYGEIYDFEKKARTRILDGIVKGSINANIKEV